MADLPEARGPAKRLSPAEREEVREALRQGKKSLELSELYGVSRQAISLIKRKMDAEAGDETAIAARQRRRSKARTTKLDPEEWDQLAGVLKSSTPLDHRFAKKDDFEPEKWNAERTIKLARKLFERTPAKSRVVKLLSELFPPPEHYPGSIHVKPQAPVRVTKADISPEFRDDPDYVAYVTSDTYWQIQQRSYELELAEYERRQAGLPPAAHDEFEDPLTAKPLPPVRPPAKRRKGPAFTKPKRRKKRK